MIQEFCTTVLLFALTIWCLRSFLSKKNKNEPPGPVSLPILGDLITVTRASVIPHEALGILAKRYGEIYKLQMGTVSTVVLASAEAVKTVYSKEDGSGRDVSGIFHDRSLKQNLGVAFANGEVFKTTRAWTMRTLKECGFGRNNSMENIIQNEADHFIEKLTAELEQNDGIFDVNLTFQIHTLNVTWIMLAGSREDKDDEKICNLLKSSDEFIRAGVFGTGLLVAYPFLRYVFPGITGYNIQMKCVKDMHNLSMEILREHKAIGHYKIQPQNFIEAYLQKMEEEAGMPNTVFTEDNFKVLFADLFQASSETTAGFLETLLLHLALNPVTQKRVLEEIENTIPEGSTCGLEHYKKMPYTQAVILECHRHAKILPQFVPHRALNDIHYKKFLIKKGTVLLPATEAMNNDPMIFERPDEFYPEHFIDKHNNLINTDKIFPFSLGKRACPGEPMAQMIAFIFIVTMLKSYSFYPEPNKPLPKTKMQLGFTMRPYPYKVLAKPRK